MTRPDLSLAPDAPSASLRDIAAGDDWHAEAVQVFAKLVGGLDALERLGAAPLPDEAFDWSAVDERDREVVAAVLDVSDRCCDEMLDVELRTAARRLLALVARRDPTPLRRATGISRIAAGLVWAVGKGNAAIGRGSRWRAADLWLHLGVSDSASIGRTLRRAGGVTVPERDQWATSGRDDWLGSPALLIGEMRGVLLRQLDATLQAAREDTTRRGAYAPIVKRSDGSISVHARPESVLAVSKGVSASGRAHVVLAFGESDDRADAVAISITEAYRLRGLLDQALADPVPTWHGS